MLPTGETATGCVNINECNESPCDANAQCADNIGSYTCICSIGYSGDGHSCVDINECDAVLSKGDLNRRNIDGNFIPTESLHADAHYINKDGIFDCACNDGYSGDGFDCADIDKCVEGGHNCDANAACTNTVVVELVHVITVTKVMMSVMLILMNVSLAFVMLTETVATMLDHTHALAMMDLMATVKPVLISMNVLTLMLVTPMPPVPTATVPTGCRLQLRML